MLQFAHNVAITFMQPYVAMVPQLYLQIVINFFFISKRDDREKENRKASVL